MKFPAKAQRRNEKLTQSLSLRFCAFAGSCLVILLCAGMTRAQSQLTISIPTTGQIKVEATLSAPARSWSFRNAYANALGLAERVEDFRAFGESGQDAQVKKNAVGEFRSELDATRISYTVKLSEPRSEH